MAKLTTSPCFYCGTPPSQRKRSPGQVGEHATYVYNGVDRVDNEVGYVAENCVPCCWRCNKAKGSMTQREFLDMAMAISAECELRSGRSMIMKES